MGIRETLNEKSNVVTGVAAGIILIALIAIIWQMLPSGSYSSSRAYYTNDDGDSYFTDSSQLITPFEKDGKQAVRAVVFRCGRDKPFVAYMERLTTEGQRLAKQNEVWKTEDPGMVLDIGPEHMEVKKPGEAQWVSYNNTERSIQVTSVNCPEGKQAQIVMP